MTQPSKVFLHIGLHKTGTTYLQNVLRANRKHCRAQGIEFPGGDGVVSQEFAVWDLQGRRPRRSADNRIEGQWAALTDAVSGSGLPTALISEERLSISTRHQIRRALASFGAAEIHVVVTARDLGRVVVSAWQEGVKNDATWTWQQFVDAVKDPDRIHTSPARAFWFRQDLPRICATWAAELPPGRLHVVTVPPSGSSPTLLLERFCSVVGLDPALLVEEPKWNNETLGVAATEALRRVNERLGGRLTQRQYDRTVKITLVPQMARRTVTTRFTVPPAELSWLTVRAEQDLAALRDAGYPVAGDLEDLRVASPPDGVAPDGATEAEVLEASLDVAAVLAEAYGTAWWQRKRDDPQVPGGSNPGSKARAALFRSQRKVVELADRNRAVGWALGVGMRAQRRLTGDRSGSST